MCINCGYYFKNYEHPEDLSDNLTNAVIGTNQDLANFLSKGYWENNNTVSRKFNLSENGLNPKNGTITYNTNGNSFDHNGISKERSFLVDEAFKLLKAKMGFNFEETDLNADINFGDEYRNSAFAYVDGRSYSSGLDFVNINIGSNWNRSTSNFGNYTFQTILHEIGHSLGLGHQGLYNGSANYSQNALFHNDSWQSSIMSYFSQIENTSINSSFAYLSTYMSADWIALDNIYSAEGFTTANAFRGDTTFGFNTNISSSTSFIYSEMSNLIDQTAYTLVDGSGIDTVDFSGFSSEQLIDLRENEIDSKTLYTSNIGGKIGNLTIASGTIIENAEGGKGSDIIYGNSADNKIFGNDGDDVINSGKGNDIIDGGSGNDFIIGSEGDNTITFGSGKDTIDYSSFKNSITLIRGGTVDKGLFGNDTFVDFYDQIYASNNKFDWIDGLSVDGNIASLNVDLKNNSLNVFNLPEIGDFISEIYNFENISGSNNNDNLFGDDQDNQIFGNNGNDFINGGKGNDIIDGGSGNDVAVFSSIKNNYLITKTINNKFKIEDTKGNDGIDIFENIEILRFTDQDLYITNFQPIGDLRKESLTYSGNKKNNFFLGTNSRDTINGFKGHDILYGNQGHDAIYGESGKDKLFGEDGDDYLGGGKGKDSLYGGGGHDYLEGGTGQDSLYGGSGNDYLKGGKGKDSLYGGGGHDVFKLSIGRGFDRIRDFNKGEDRVDIAEFDINQLVVYESGKNLKVYLDWGKSDLLAIIYNQNLNEGSISDFIF